jgi:V/A-type H+/Na+-transporting ATPase subunit K
MDNSIFSMENGLGLAVAGGMVAVMFGAWGSARGLRFAGAQTAGALAEKPELFGKLLVLTALPGTQGFYGLIGAIFIAMRTGLMQSAEKGLPVVAPGVGLALFAVGSCLGVALCISAINQGQTSAACINLTARKPEEAGRSILFPALVETYAVVALLAAILLIIWITPATTAVAQ